MISVPNQLVGAYEGQTLTLECQSEAYPKSINYWTKENGEIIAQGKFCSIFINKIHFLAINA
jgi:neurotrimin